MKRILLFVATNAAVLLLLSVTMQLLGIESILDEQGVALDLNSLLVFSAVLGFGGSFMHWAMSASLAMSVAPSARNLASSLTPTRQPAHCDGLRLELTRT